MDTFLFGAVWGFVFELLFALVCSNPCKPTSDDPDLQDDEGANPDAPRDAVPKRKMKE
jgi:hypothetical protein